MAKYVVNSAMMPNDCFGYYYYQPVTLEFAQDWLKKGDFISRIGYAATAAVIQQATGVPVEVNRGQTLVRPGDEMLVFRLKYRVNDPGLKKYQNPDIDDFEIGLITYLGNGGAK